MEILSCETKRNNIIYTVKTKNGFVFNHSLPKDTPSYQVRKVLKILEVKIDDM